MSTGRIVSIQTTAERGGAEYANVDLLDALRERGHDVRLVTNLPDLATGTDLVVRRIDLGPKLSHRTVSSVGLAAPVIVWRLAQALWRERPVAATLVHFKKEQLLVALLPGRLTGRIVWAEWGRLIAYAPDGLDDPGPVYSTIDTGENDAYRFGHDSHPGSRCAFPEHRPV